MRRGRIDGYGVKRQEILDAAATLFAKAGYANTKMTDIGRRCHASKSMLYHYFPGKEDLLFELTREHAEGHLTALEEVLSAPLPPRERLRAFAAAWLRRSLASRGRHTVLMYDLKFLPVRQQRMILGLQRRMVERLAELIAEVAPAVREEGNHRPKVLALLLFGMLNWTDTWLDSSGPKSSDEIAERAHRLFLGGIAAER
ncbi:MAG TPA: TetR/AcrR family transcriptional regulator [Anaeromyxobacter sp.]